MGGKATDKLVERWLSALDETPAERAAGLLEALGGKAGRPAYASLLRILTHLELGEDEARAILLSALRHRDALSAKLGRPVSARVALFDHLVSVERRLSNPKFVEITTFDRIERSAITDHLTGLYNRLYFDSRLRREVQRARRFGQHISLLLLDLDDFKSINDRNGHPAGDSVLREVGRLIVGRIRDIDIASRYGGEEFAVILPETPRPGAHVVAERIRREVERHFRRKTFADRALNLTLSGGLACFAEDAEDDESLLARADQALYRAKRSGKNTIVTFFQEKRRAERVDIEDRNVRAVVQVRAGGGQVRRTARVKNLSEGGILLELSEPVPVGCEISVSFSLGGDQDYALPSKVVRLEEFASNGKRRRFAAGVRFQRRVKALQPHLHRMARGQQAAAG